MPDLPHIVEVCRVLPEDITMNGMMCHTKNGCEELLHLILNPYLANIPEIEDLL